MEARGAALTRERLITAALAAFSVSGFDGVSARAIERAAGVERGLIGYHFSSKLGLWEAAVDAVFQRLFDQLEPLRAALQDVSRKERARALLIAFGRFSARNPEFFRIVLFEGHRKTERSEHVARHLWYGIELFRDFTDTTGPVGAEEAILIYQVIGAGGMLYAASAYFDEDVRAALNKPESIEAFAKTLAASALTSGIVER